MDPSVVKPSYKPLPNGWIYLLSRKDARALGERFVPHVACVEFSGTGLKPKDKYGFGLSCCAGVLEARCTEDGWLFRLEQRGIPAGLVGDARDRLRDLILVESRQFCGEHLRLRPDPTSIPVELRFFLEQEKGVWQPRFSRWNIDGLEAAWSARNPWWE